MTPRVEIIGGGPGGLYLARLLKLGRPAMDVVVHERMAGAAQTFGFGVGLTESTMRNMRAADPETAEATRAASYGGHELRLHGVDGMVPLHGARNLAIGRARLLDVLGQAALAAGVEVRRGSAMDVASVEADIVVGADGVGSATREKYAAELGVHASLGRTRFVWCGADFAVDAAYFSAVRRGESLFVAHAYPYAADRSTFLIEADDLTWRDAGLDVLDQRVAPGQTDTASVELLEDVFAPDLRGRRLLTNRTRWSRFRELRLDRWAHDNMVLLGDAAHTAHYTLGSGTKLALEDAIALAQAILGEGSVPAAFAAYEETRRPPVERFKQLAQRSQAWWDSYRHRHAWPAARLALSYMTRSGNITLGDFAREEPDVVGDALSWLGAPLPASADGRRLEEWVLSRPLREGDLVLPARQVRRAALNSAAPVHEVEWRDPDVWGERADALIVRVAGAGDCPVLLTGPADPRMVLARVDLAERIRLETARPVGVQLPEPMPALAATTIAAERADFVVVS